MKAGAGVIALGAAAYVLLRLAGAIMGVPAP